MIEGVNMTTELIVGIGGACAVLLAWLRWVRPKIRSAREDGTAIRDAILGRDEVRDSITKEVISPALPGIGQRMANTEAQMAIITDAVAKLADTHTRLDNHEGQLTEHDKRIQRLEGAAVERVVSRAESAAAWRAMEAAALAQPDETSDES